MKADEQAREDGDRSGDAARWERVKDIVADALEREGAARADFVAESCAGDAALRAEVDALLASYGVADDFLDGTTRAFELLGPETRAPKGLQTGEHLGPYEIRRKLGEGGFSTVYGALQKQPIERRVAIKLIKPGMDSAQVLARFEKEREALLRMEHPNIARVLDAGVSDAGHPYFVMDWVDGEAFTQYCDRKQLSVRARLALFLQVCSAVQHAHVKGVVHRDLKPSNILVAEQDGEPVVKVIDFGIAKALGEDDAGASLLTQSGMYLGTPEYMSPEQAGGTAGDVDTRADVYSLGVLLYEALTGTRPFVRPEPEQAALHEVLRRIREDEAPRPSTRIEPSTEEAAALRRARPRELARELRGDLDWIVMKSLEKDRERRYGSVAGFAEDVQRHLGDEPVLAGPPSLGYRFAKFARRNRALLGAASLALLALLAGGVLAGVGFYQASAERDAAVRARDGEARARAAAEASLAEADRVADFLAGMFDSISAYEGGKDLRVYDLLENADFGDLADFPQVEIRLRSLVGTSYKSLGEFERARAQLERALELARREEGADSARSLQIEVTLANVRYDQTAQAGDRALLEDLIARSARALGEEHETTWNARASFAGFLFDSGDYEAAIPQMRSVLARSIERWGASRMRGNLAIALLKAQKLDEALQEARRNLEEHREHFSRDHYRVLGAERVLATVYLQRGEWATARKMLRGVCARHEQKLGADHPATLGVYNYYLMALQKLRDYEAAAPIYERTLRAQESSLGPDHRQTIMCLHNFGMMLFDAGELERAEGLLRDAFARFARVRGEEHVETAQARFHLAQLLIERKKMAEGMPLLREAVKKLSRAAGWKHPKTREAAYLLSRKLGPVFGEQLRAKDRAMLETLKLAWSLARRLDDDKEKKGVARAYVSAYEALGEDALAEEWRARAR